MIRTRPRGTARGAALPLVVLLLLALTALGHGALQLAEAERVAAGALARQVAGRSATRAVVARSVARIRADTVLLAGGGGEVPLGGERAVEAGVAGQWSWETAIRRPGREIHLLVTSLEHPTAGRRRVAQAVWRLDPLARVDALRAVIEAGAGVSAPPGGIVGASAFGPVDAADTARCPPFRSAIDSIRSPWTDMPRWMELPGAAGAMPGLGALEGDSLAGRLVPLPAGTVRPEPSFSADGCTTSDPLNWGDPLDPDGMCAAHRVQGYVPGSLVVGGRGGQGVLAVAGDLALTGGAIFRGVLLVGGDLALAGGSRLIGAARVRGTVRIESGATAVGSACSVIVMLADAPRLDRPYVLPEPPFPLH